MKMHKTRNLSVFVVVLIIVIYNWAVANMDSISETCDRAKVLIMEDDMDMRAMMKNALEERGYHVRTAESAIEGLETMRVWRPDLVLLDVMMPGMDGLEALNEIKNDEILKSTPVVMVSIMSDMKTKMSSFLAGAKRYITKPFMADELAAEVRNTLRQTANTRITLEKALCDEDANLTFEAEAAGLFE